MKKSKKILASLLSATLAVSSFSSLGASALYYANDSETISQKMTDNGFTYVPEVIDDFSYVSGEDKEKMENGLWLIEEQNDFMWFVYKRVIDDFSVFYFDISSEDYSAVVEKLKAEIGYSDKVDIKVCNESRYNEETKKGVKRDVGVEVSFSENGADLNYMITEKIASVLKEDYNVTSSLASFGRASLGNMQVKMQTFPINNVKELEAMTEEQLSACIDEFNKTLADNGFDVRSYKADDKTLKEFNENSERDWKVLMCLDIPEDMTVQEKMRYTTFIQERYDLCPYRYGLASSAPSSSEPFDILEVENHYNHGDANGDGTMNIADAAAIVQAIGNKDKYGLTAQGEFNADLDGNGLTGADAVAIQIMVAEAGMPE